jgi:threonine dehydrogenase-like Zn-dependent dehydrogenase
MGASRVIAAGRNPVALETVARAGGSRVSTVTLKGDVQADAGALRESSGGGAHMAFDMVGQARDPNATLAALHSLRRGGRLVLIGSMTTELPIPYTTVMLNSWEILGRFMYPATALSPIARLGAQRTARHQPDPPACVPARRAAGSHGSRCHRGQSRMYCDAAVASAIATSRGCASGQRLSSSGLPKSTMDSRPRSSTRRE